MSEATTREARCILAFPHPGALASFLLTCLEVNELAPRSEIYEQHLNRIFVPRQGEQRLYIAARGAKEVIQQAIHVALANGGTMEKYRVIDPAVHHVLTIPKLFRLVRLQAVNMEGVRPPHVLAALWGATADVLGEFLRYLWTLGVQQCEVAFIKLSDRNVPSHFVRIHGMRHTDAFYTWCSSLTTKIELYSPQRSDGRESRIYVLWGYRHPVMGLDQLVELDRELVLLQRKRDSVATQWITFRQGEVNFFRKAYEFVDLKIDVDEVPLLELEEDAQAASVPLELSLIAKQKTGTARLWQLDKQIDRQRRVLHDLEMQRAHLASGEIDEVYFAYRFDQQGENELNPRMVRLLEQRVGTLSNYEYAFCRPKRGNPFHVVISNRSQRQMGFSLQAADRAYYQPAQWRRWGVNLFIPLHSELAPRIDSNDVLPILQRIVERSADAKGDEAEGKVLDNAAVLWDPGREGVIDETRVVSTVPLLSQFHLLNSFQRATAKRVAEESRRRMVEDLHRARQDLSEQYDGLTRELLGYVVERTEKLSERYAQLETSLESAKKLVDAAAPRMEEVKQFITDLPNEWVAFVEKIIELQRSVAAAELAAISELRGRLNIHRPELRALAANGRDLVAAARLHVAHLHEEIAACEETIKDARIRHKDVEQMSQRGAAVLHEVSRMHRQLDERITRLQQMQQQIQKMQDEIDQLEARESAVRRSLDEVRRRFEEMQAKSSEVERLDGDVKARENSLIQRAAELARRREELKQRFTQMAYQMEHIEAHLLSLEESNGDIKRSSGELEQQLALVDAHVQAIARWDGQKTDWQKYLTSQQEVANERMQQVQNALMELQEQDLAIESYRDHVAKAREHVTKAEALAAKTKERSHA